MVWFGELNCDIKILLQREESNEYSAKRLCTGGITVELVISDSSSQWGENQMMMYN